MSIWERMDAQTVTSKASMGPLPEGNYEAIITDVEIKEDPFATNLSVEFTVDSGENKGRKCWFNTKLDDQTSDKKLAFVKGQICKMAGVDSTGGDPMTVLANVKLNKVLIDVKHTPSTKDPSKTFTNVYVNACIDTNEPNF